MGNEAGYRDDLAATVTSAANEKTAIAAADVAAGLAAAAAQRSSDGAALAECEQEGRQALANRDAFFAASATGGNGTPPRRVSQDARKRASGRG